MGSGLAGLGSVWFEVPTGISKVCAGLSEGRR